MKYFLFLAATAGFLLVLISRVSGVGIFYNYVPEEIRANPVVNSLH